jgi:hypothetical protein
MRTITKYDYRIRNVGIGIGLRNGYLIEQREHGIITRQWWKKVNIPYTDDWNSRVYVPYVGTSTSLKCKTLFTNATEADTHLNIILAAREQRIIREVTATL